MDTLTKKFSPEELGSIKSLQEKYQEILVNFGKLSLERIALEEAIKNLHTAEAQLKAEFESLQKSEKSLTDSIADKYGDGVLSLKDGTFTPSS